MFIIKWHAFKDYFCLVSTTLGKHISEFVFYAVIFSIAFCLGYYIRHVGSNEYPVGICLMMLLIMLAGYFISLYVMEFLFYIKALWLKLKHPELVWTTCTTKNGRTYIAVVPEDVSEKSADEILDYLIKDYFKIKRVQ